MSEQDRADVVAERAAPCSLPGASFAEQVKSIAPETLVVLDETGVSTKLTRRYARAPRGRRACGSAPGHWRRLTVRGALALGGLVAVMTVAVATDWPVFQAFLQQVVIPALRQHKPGATVVMDHLAAHRIPQARVLLALRQAQERRLHAAAPAALLPRPVADRAVLVQAQDAAARGRAALDRRYRRTNRSGP